MRLSFVLPATMAVVYFVACNATVDYDQTNVSMMGSPDFIRSLDAGQTDDAASRRFLREHKKKNGASSAGERVFGIGTSPKKQVQKLAKEMFNDPSKQTEGFKKWKSADHTWDGIKKWLKLEEDETYLRIYNGYSSHRYQF